MKRILGIAAGILLTCVLAMSASAVTMYSSDGRTIEVEWNDVAAHKKVGWYESVNMYKTDGSVMLSVNPFEVQKYENEGWVRGTKMYNLSIGLEIKNNGYSQYASEAYGDNPSYVKKCNPLADKTQDEQNGWFEGVVAFDARNNICVIPPYEVIAQKGYTRAVTLYAPDGRILYVHPNEAQIYKNAGWKEGIILFAEIYDGKFKTSVNEDIGFNDSPEGERKYKQYVQEQERIKRLTFTVTKTVNPYTWDNELGNWCRAVKMFARDGRTLIIPSIQEYQYEKLGWYSGIIFYNANNEERIIPSFELGGYGETVREEEGSREVGTISVVGVRGETDEIRQLAAEGWLMPIEVYAVSENQNDVNLVPVADSSSDYRYVKRPQYKTLQINPHFLEDYLNAGWLKSRPRFMCSADGRVICVEDDKAEEYEKVGWYSYYQIMYSEDGRTIYVPKEYIETYKAVGWYTSKNELMVTVYAADGRTMQIFRGQLEAYKAVGWYPGITIYKAINKNEYNDGDKYNSGDIFDHVVPGYCCSKRINPYEFEDYAKHGWYTEPVIYVRKKNSYIVIFSSQFADYKAEGWEMLPTIFWW